MRDLVAVSAGLGPFLGESRRNVVGLFPHPRPAERLLRRFLAGAAELAAISVVAQDRRPALITGGAQRECASAVEGLLTLALDGALGRRVGAGVLAVGYPEAVVIVGALATRLPDLSRGTLDPLGELFVAGGVPRSALASYLAAIRAGQSLVMVEAVAPEREHRLRHTFARHGAVALRSFPAPPPRRHPVVPPGTPAPSRAALARTDLDRVPAPRVTALPEAPEAWAG